MRIETFLAIKLRFEHKFVITKSMFLHHVAKTEDKVRCYQHLLFPEVPGLWKVQPPLGIKAGAKAHQHLRSRRGRGRQNSLQLLPSLHPVGHSNWKEAPEPQLLSTNNTEEFCIQPFQGMFKF